MIAVLAFIPVAISAQVSSGIVIERGDPAHSVGVQVSGALGVDLTSRLGLQFEAGYVMFGKTPDLNYMTPCLPPSAGQPPCYMVHVPGTRLELWSGTVNLRLMEQRDRNSLYWTAGVGAYALSYDATRFGLNVGGGMRLSRAFALDVRYHQLIDAKTTRSLVPITVRYAF